MSTYRDPMIQAEEDLRRDRAETRERCEAPAPLANGLASFILSMAIFAGEKERADGTFFQLWTLRKPLDGHPKGSTVSRATLERAYKAGYRAIAAKYGATAVDCDDPALGSVESPAIPQ